MVVLLVTTESSGLDRYSQELAARLPVRTVRTRRYLTPAEEARLEELIVHLPEVVHLPNQHLARYALRRTRPYLVTVHDVVRLCLALEEERPEEQEGLRRDIEGIQRAAQVITVSETTRADLVRYLGLAPARVTVVYNGVDHRVFQPRGRASKERPLPAPYIMYAGSERPRKNLRRLVEAFALLKKEFPALKLVKAGEPGREQAFRQALRQHIAALGLEGEVIFTGYLSDEELAHYYRFAEVFVYPSLYEGFGLPVLEAMACGCPVVTSNTSALQEVSGDAALTVDPQDVPAIAAAVASVLRDSSLRNQLVQRGLERAKLFSWDHAARETARVYEQVAKGLDIS